MMDKDTDAYIACIDPSSNKLELAFYTGKLLCNDVITQIKTTSKGVMKLFLTPLSNCRGVQGVAFNTFKDKYNQNRKCLRTNGPTTEVTAV